MKLLAAFFTFLSFTSVAHSSWLDGGNQVAINDDEDFPVPGKNPLKFCAKPDDNILNIDHVDLDPNPPKP